MGLKLFQTYLDKTVPMILGLSPVTVWAHLISHHKLDHECLQITIIIIIIFIIIIIITCCKMAPPTTSAWT